MTTQSEAQLENNLISQVVGFEFEQVKINNADVLKANLKQQLEKANHLKLTDSEFENVLVKLEKGSIFDKSKRLKGKIERTVYNRRRRKLAFKIELLRQHIAFIVVPAEDYHIVDSMLLEVCKYSRSSRTKVCPENTQTSPSFGYCAAQQMH